MSPSMPSPRFGEAVLVRPPAERQALMNEDVLDPERARLLDHAETGALVVKEEAASVRAPLGVTLPGGHAPSLGELVHPLEITLLVGIDAPVDQQSMRALHRIDDAPDLIGLLDRQQLFLAMGGDERQHHHVSVGIEKDVLDELLRTAEPGFAEPMLADEVTLHVEDKLTAPEAIEGDRRIDRGHLFQLEESAGSARSGVDRIEGQQRACGATSGNHKGPAVDSTPPRILTRPRLSQPVRTTIGGVKRDRNKFAVGGGIQLDWEAFPFGVGVEPHGAHPLKSIDHTFHSYELAPVGSAVKAVLFNVRRIRDGQ
jgi:hypothetical protein